MRSVLIFIFLEFSNFYISRHMKFLEKMQIQKLWKYLILKLYMFQGEMHELYLCMYGYL